VIFWCWFLVGGPLVVFAVVGAWCRSELWMFSAAFADNRGKAF